MRGVQFSNKQLTTHCQPRYSVKIRLAFRLVLLCTLGLMFSSSFAGNKNNIDQLSNLIDSQFRDLTKDLGAVITVKPQSSSENYHFNNKRQFGIGMQFSATTMESDALQHATSGQASDVLYVPKLQLNTGLSDALGIGAFYSSVPDSNMQMFGGELNYALLMDQRSSPALSLRGSYSALYGVEDLDLTTTGLELAISKGFASFTPYAGIGTVWIDGQYDPNGFTERLTQRKYFLGLNFKLGIVTFAAETEQTGENTSTSAKASVKF